MAFAAGDLGVRWGVALACGRDRLSAGGAWRGFPIFGGPSGWRGLRFCRDLFGDRLDDLVDPADQVCDVVGARVFAGPEVRFLGGRRQRLQDELENPDQPEAQRVHIGAQRVHGLKIGYAYLYVKDFRRILFG